mgnify:CR=1 FL=1
MSLIHFFDMEWKTSSRHGKLTNEIFTTCSHQSKKVPISSFFITVEWKIFLKLGFIHSTTRFVSKLIPWKQNPPEIDKIFVALPTLLLMLALTSHIMNRIHVVLLGYVVVHDMMCEIERWESIWKKEKLVVNLFIWWIHLFLS